MPLALNRGSVYSRRMKIEVLERKCHTAIFTCLMKSLRIDAKISMLIKKLSRYRECVSECTYFTAQVQYSPKIMHAQEVAQEVLAPQEHASGKKK